MNDIILEYPKISGIVLILIGGNVLVYGLLRGLARNLANKNRIENPLGFS